MSDRFLLATAHELRPDLENVDRNFKMQRAALNRLVANMTVNNQEMLSLLPQVVKCMRSSDTEIKRMCYLYLETFAKVRPQQASEAVQYLLAECQDVEVNPKTRAIALRSLSSIHAKEFRDELYAVVVQSLKSKEPYMRKTACNAVIKLWSHNKSSMDINDILKKLNKMFVHETNASVLGATIQALKTVTEGTPDMQFVLDFNTAKKLAMMLEACPEYSQVSILSVLVLLVPETEVEAEELAELLVPGLRHTNSAVVLGTVRVLMMLSHYNLTLQQTTPKLVFNALLSQLNRPPEIQYGILRNFYVLLQTIDDNTIQQCDLTLKPFFYQASDLPYIRSTKIDILVQLSSPSNIDTLIREIKVHIEHLDDKLSRNKAIAALGQLGTKFMDHSLTCVKSLQENADEPDGVVALVQIARKFNTSKPVILAVQNALNLKEQIPKDMRARVAYIWFTGVYGSKSDNLQFAELVDHLEDEPVEVILSLFTALLRAHFKFQLPTLIESVIEFGEQSKNPDIRLRATFYRNLLNANAQPIMDADLPPIDVKDHLYSYAEMEDLELSVGYLSSIFMKPATQLFRVAQQHELQNSPCILPRRISSNLKQKSGPKLMRRQTTLTLGEQVQQMHIQPAIMQSTPTGGFSERLIDL